jgi:hypothetical protein
MFQRNLLQPCSRLKAVCSSETLVFTCKDQWCYNPGQHQHLHFPETSNLIFATLDGSGELFNRKHDLYLSFRGNVSSSTSAHHVVQCHNDTCVT